MHKGKDAGIARLLKPDGISHAGMGILVDRRRIVSCAHVVNTAMGRWAEAEEMPTGKVGIAFPLASDPRKTMAARVICWGPDDGNGDISVLELDEDAPAEVGFAVLTHFEASLENNPLKIFGMPKGDGRHVDVRYQGLTANVEVQLDGDAAAENFVEGGYSGAGVWNSAQGAFIGMVRSIAADGEHTAFLTPVGSLQQACPSLPIERRRLSATFLRTWTMGIALFIGATFYLFGGNLWWTTFSHPQLAAFAGMHVYPILGPFIAWLLLSHARDYQFHPWSTRVPKLAGLRNFESGSAEDQQWAAALLIVLTAFPVYAQVHFLKEFHNEGHVYIYPRDFGFEATELQAMVRGPACLNGSAESGNRKCRHPDAGRYSTVTPKPGAEGGYWKNRYHYGDVRPRGRQSMSFFPTLQPVVVILASISTLIFSLCALRFVLGDHREKLLTRQRLHK